MCLDFYAVGLRGLVVDCGASGRDGGGDGGGDGGIWLILATCWWAVGIWSTDPAGDVTEGVVVVGSGGGTPASGIWRYWFRCCCLACLLDTSDSAAEWRGRAVGGLRSLTSVRRHTIYTLPLVRVTVQSLTLGRSATSRQ